MGLLRRLAPALLLALVPLAAAGEPLPRDAVRAFVERMVQRHGFAREELEQLFAEARLQRRILEAIARPAESLPWHRYRDLFVQEGRIREGVAFWDRHAAVLERAERRYGVPPEVVTAILGVESRYGRHRGGWRVLDALSTLAFAYPPRARFFARELEQYLLLTREEGLDPLRIKGSYAGAMGQAQFIPSSYRHYAVDFDADGRRDLWEDTEDAIGSVAHYLHRHGWVRGGAVAVPARVQGDPAPLVKLGLRPRLTVAELRRRGVEPTAPVPEEARAALVALEGEAGPEHWLGLRNFYVITRYNHSALYAMAVHQLAEAIRERRTGRTASR